ncbi:MAG: sensor histidine kinase [Clostridiales bacterium]|nr:sensor histidine kinase [Clostridiales bacterium]MDD7122537.1 sensor histidine kinase [Clostridiales bacterium]MDY5468370.1 sensor histidine kinase [Eubacteriales bacterium]
MKGFFRLYLRAQRRGMLFWGFCCLIFTVSFALYGLPLGAVLYPAALCAAAGGIILLLSLRKSRAVCQELSLMQHHPADLPDELPAAQSPQEQAYQALLLALHADRQKLKSNMNARYHDMTEYYTVWAHQIKTPIAAIRLALQNEDTPLSRRLTGEVGRVEQYVQMALTYLRLGSDSSDYVIRSCALDDIVRPAVRRFAGEFIQRKIQLNYQMLNYTVITDEKWLGFVVEQVLSNALKYTPQGSVSIYMEPEGVLCIRDTGIGIAPEDLPRVFEKGYTGYNGRSHRKASGLGLYLCREILTRLGHSVSAESQVDHGTTIRIDLRQHKTIQE